jgi:non-homologous end joining protein Ku
MEKAEQERQSRVNEQSNEKVVDILAALKASLAVAKSSGDAADTESSD